MQLMGLLIVFACLFAGQVIVRLTQLPLPPSIIGLLLLFVLLSLKKVRLEQVQPIAQPMLSYLAFMIVPACISIMQYLDILKADIVPLLVGTVLSTLLVLISTAKTHQWVRQYISKTAKKRTPLSND